MWVWIAFIVFIAFICLVYLVSPMLSPCPLGLKNTHVLVTGGSSGIGKSLAKLATKQGAKVTIVARNQEKLVEAREEIAYSSSKDHVQIASVDLSKNFEDVQTAFDKAESTFGPVSVLINCAGNAVSGRFEDVPLSVFQKMLDINYMSAVNATRALLPGMKSRSGGRIVFVSSQAGQLGVFGFSAYSASKYALRGLAEALQMEVKPYNVYVTMAFPPDTDTPGYLEEQKTKPEETRLISETSGLFPPEKVASTILEDTVRGSFFSSVGLDGMMLTNLTCGFSPTASLMEALQQVMTMGLFRLISLLYLYHFDGIIKKCKLKREGQKKAQ